MRPPALETERVTVYVGHVLDVLREMPDASADMCVTSPPYYGLRAYKTDPQIWGGDVEHAHAWGQAIAQTFTAPPGSAKQASNRGASGVAGVSSMCACGAWRGELGLEPTPELFVEHIGLVFAEVRRILRPHGTLWLNLGDSYANDTKWGGSSGGSISNDGQVNFPRHRKKTGLKGKDLIGIPWMVAFALRAAGWYLRGDIVWAKPNAMPESIEDRPTRSHEFVFMLAKSARYYFDQDAVREPPVEIRDGKPHERVRGVGGREDAYTYGAHGAGFPTPEIGRNIRDVWTIATEPYPEAHFATFPEELPRRAIMASCPLEVCATCAKPRTRIVKRTVAAPPNGSAPDETYHDASGGHSRSRAPTTFYRQALSTTRETVGWTDCGHGAFVPGTVLDPFSGSGTTLAVASGLGRRAVGVELQPDYVPLIERRVRRTTTEMLDQWRAQEPITLPPADEDAPLGPLWDVER